jgi:hypothetical protein
MHSLLWKVFSPYEVRLTVAEAKAFLAKSAGASRSLIEPAVVSLARDAEKTIYSVRIDHMKPDHLALLLITNVVGNQIGSGSHHTYRGVLNGLGTDLLAIWNGAQQALLERGYASEAEVAKDNQWIQQQIRDAG